MDTTQQKQIDDLQQQLSSVSVPILDVVDNIAMVPMMGIIDSAKSQLLMQDILVHVRDAEIKVIIIDIMGIFTVDSAVAAHLIKMTKATKLLGCTTIISGISPEIAQIIVNLGIDLSGVETTSNLKYGLKSAYRLVGLEITSK